MGYSPVPLVTTGDLWTASNNNTYVRDNFNQTAANVCTSAGDVPYALTANTVTRLGASNGGVMQTDDAKPTWLEMSATKYHRVRAKLNEDGIEYRKSSIGEYVTSTGQSIPVSTVTAISFQYKAIDIYDMWSAGNPTKIFIPSTFPASRWYHICGYFHLPGDIGNKNFLYQLRFRLNGTTLFGGQTIYLLNQTPVYHLSASIMKKLEPNDYVQLIAYHEDTGLTPKTLQSRFSVFMET